MNQPLTLALLLPALLFACSKKKEDTHAPTTAKTSSLVREIVTDSPVKAEALYRGAHLHCKNTDCPAAVGLFVAKDGSNLRTCTASLVGPDLAITNSHCLTSAIKLSPNLCAERVQIIFPATSQHAEEKVACAKLLGHTPLPAPYAPDLSVIRLERQLSRAPLVASREGALPEKTLVAYKVNPLADAPLSPSGELVRDECRTIGRSYIFPLYQSAKDPVFVTGDCRSIPGNSGSPILDEKQQVVGLLQAELLVTDEQRAAWKPYLRDADFAPLGLGTSLGCLLEGEAFRADCSAPVAEELQRTTIRDYADSTEPEVAPILAARADSVFGLTRATHTNRVFTRDETLAPACLLPVEKWPAELRTEASQSKLEVTITAPVVESRLELNRYTQTFPTVHRRADIQTVYSFSPVDFFRTGESVVERDGKSATLKACP